MGALDASVRGSIPRILTIWHLSSKVEHRVEASGVAGALPAGATKLCYVVRGARSRLANPITLVRIQYVAP